MPTHATTDPAARWMRPVGTALFGVSGAGFVAVALLLLAAPPGWSIGTLVGDDAGYYFAIARNATLGYGFSFDRIHSTNGFNPLFPWLLIPLYHLLPSGLPLVACYRVGVLVDLLAVAGAWSLFLRMLAWRLEQDGWAPHLRRLALASASAFFVLFIGTKSYYGMDAPLVLLLGIAYLARVQRVGPLAAGPTAVIDGLVLGLLFLARVDTLPLIAAALAVMAIQVVATRRGLGGLVTRLAVAAVVCAPYLVWSVYYFGTWMPVSARIKSSFPLVDPGRSLAMIRHTSLGIHDQAAFLIAWLAAWGVLAAYAPRVVAAFRTRTAMPHATSALVLFALYIAGRLTFMLLFSRADVQGSYAILAHAFNVLVVATLVGAWMRRQPIPAHAWRGAALASLLLAGVALGLFAGKVAAARERARTAAALGLRDQPTFGAEVHDHTRDGDVLFGESFGLLGFFADRPFINGDGVVNTYAYQRMFLAPEGALARYFRENRVTHVVFGHPRNATFPPGVIRFDAHGVLYDRASSVELDPSNIVLRRAVSYGMGGASDVVVARVRAE